MLDNEIIAAYCEAANSVVYVRVSVYIKVPERKLSLALAAQTPRADLLPALKVINNS